MKTKNKIMFIVLYILMIVIFSFVLSNQYKYSHIQENELTTVSEVFDYSTKGKNHYTIYCESGNKYNISYISADDEHIDFLKAGDVLALGLDHKQVLKLEANGLTIISIEDCNYRYTKQFKVSVIICPIMIMVVVLIHIGLNFWLKKIENDYKCNYNNSIVKTNEIIDKKLYKKIQDSIYKKEGYLRCNILEQIKSDELVYTFYKAMIDYLNDRELVLLIDDGCLDDGLAMAFYKDKEKLYFEMIYRDGKEPFEIEEKLFWYYPYNYKVTKEEQREFNNAVEEYIAFNKDLLKKVGK